ncbi:hypothetical protein T459_17559 [Capsicum annuum]|uniref:RNase H type-1 domain-containing protein n=1 Tax=Capsicum annuum TaxID=4072 RepID=A0A2G2ZBW9_CAPAN|nr:hypothetical protein T459_17559 [Capsicum annuum]
MNSIMIALNKIFPMFNINMPLHTVCDLIRKLRPIPNWKIVCWKKPMTGRVKLNTDGSYLHDSGKAGIGGIIRNEFGDLLMAFAVSVVCNSNNMAEILATSYGVDLCLNWVSWN